METMSKNLQILSERAWALHDKIDDEIEKDSFKICRLCSEKGLYCEIADKPLEERERLIAIRDILKEVENMLVFLQRLGSSHERNLNVALARLEESRIHLMQKANQYQQKGRKLEVIEELNECFNGEKISSRWKLKDEEKTIQLNVEKTNPWFSISKIICLFNPWNWNKSSRIGLKLIVVITSISSIYNCNRHRQEFNFPTRNFSWSTKTANQDYPLDVSCGMG
ncbi:hypothetical protein LguiA_019043 [Lonicera macranthoides]